MTEMLMEEKKSGRRFTEEFSVEADRQITERGHQVVRGCCTAWCQRFGAVSTSTFLSQRIACSRLSPHMSLQGWREVQTLGRSGWPKILQRSCSSSCTHLTPAGFPFGNPGMALEIDGAIQHAPHRSRQFIL